MLAPTQLNGSGADPSKAPDIVLNMWGYAGACDNWYDPVMQRLAGSKYLAYLLPQAPADPVAAAIGLARASSGWAFSSAANGP